MVVDPSLQVDALVNIDGNNATPVIRFHKGVSSIADNGTGDYTINWSTDFADTNYLTVGSTGASTTTNGDNYIASFNEKAVGLVKTSTTDDTGTARDADEFMVIAIGDN